MNPAKKTFALLVNAAPFSTQGPATALRFARAAITAGHNIERVFFFRDGVHCANLLAVSPQDERNIPAEWQQFCAMHTIDAVVCVSAAVKRGIVDERESRRHNLPVSNLATPMLIAGLGQLHSDIWQITAVTRNHYRMHVCVIKPFDIDSCFSTLISPSLPLG